MAENRQLPLALALAPRYGIEDFLVSGSNADAYAMIEAWPAWPGRMLALVGPEASGKTHLSAIWAERAGARTLSGRALPRADLPALAAAGAVAVEDADSTPIAETELFHLLNLAAERGAHVLVTAAREPSAWSVAMPDLMSRLRKMPTVSIAQPDDALLRALLVKLFVDRQIIVDMSLVEYLLPRVERSFAGLARIVAALDREGLARGRRLTRAMAAELLGSEADE
jgi:chromosomal replication initiation ATPase DnaA